MPKEIELNIEFQHALTEKEQMTFWDSLVEEIESVNAFAGGGHDSESLSWVIDISESAYDKGEVLERLGDFLLKNDELVLNWKIE